LIKMVTSVFNYRHKKAGWA